MTTENELLNTENGWRWHNHEDNSYAERKIRHYAIFLKGEYLDFEYTEKEAQEFIENDIICCLEEGDYVTKSDYEIKPLYE